MNQLTNISTTSEMTMTSIDFLNNVINPAREAAGESEVANRHFVARVEDELDDLPAGKTFTRFGNVVKYYDLTLEQMTLVGMRESKAVRRAVLAKLKELEQPATPALPQTYLAALEALVESEKEKEALRLEVQEAAPKVDYYDAIVDSKQYLTVSDVAAKLEISANALNIFLEQSGAYDMRIVNSSKRKFKNSFIQEGYAVIKKEVYGNNSYDRAYITPKGEARIIEKYKQTKGL